MASPDLNQQLQQAIQLAQSGQTSEARQLLKNIVNQAPRFTPAWLWLASLEPNQSERASILRHVLSIDPNNEQAKSALQKLGISLQQPSLTKQAQFKNVNQPQSSFQLPSTDELPLVFKIIIAAVIVGVLILVVRVVVSQTVDVPEETPTATIAPATITPILVTPTITNTPGPSPTPIPRNTLPPEFTPTPAENLSDTKHFARCYWIVV